MHCRKNAEKRKTFAAAASSKENIARKLYLRSFGFVLVIYLDQKNIKKCPKFYPKFLVSSEKNTPKKGNIHA